jgi:hypothetical protein
MLDYIGEVEGGEVDVKVDFIAPELVAEYVHPGARFLVMEGRRPVAEARITKVFDERMRAAGQ